MKKRYTVLLFDLDDTLLDFTGDEIRALKTVLSKHGLPCGDDVIETYYGIENWQFFVNFPCFPHWLPAALQPGEHGNLQE